MSQPLELHDQRLVDDLHHSSVFNSKYAFVFGLAHDLSTKGAISHENMVELLKLTNAALFVLHIEVQNNEAEKRYEARKEAERIAAHQALTEEVERRRAELDAVLELREVAPFAPVEIPDWLRDLSIDNEGGDNGTV